MKRPILSVRDRAADTFGQPFFPAALGQGIRSFGDEVNRAAQDNPLYAHPEDFDLYEVGVWDDTTGTFESLEGGPRMLAIGKDVKVK